MHDGETTVGDQGGDAGDNRVANIVLADDVAASGYNFGELGLRADYISVHLHLASNPPIDEVARALVARGEEVAGNTELAEQIRDGGTDFDPGPGDGTPINHTPVANEDTYGVAEDVTLTIDADEGLLANDSDVDADPLTAVLVTGADHGQLTLNSDGTLETGFNPDANNTVAAIAVQPDGKILIGGYFTTVGGQERNRIARLNADGTLDTWFNPPRSNAHTIRQQ